MTRWRCGAHRIAIYREIGTYIKMDDRASTYDAYSPVTKRFSYFAFIKSSCAINSGIS